MLAAIELLVFLVLLEIIEADGARVISRILALFRPSALWNLINLLSG